MGLIEKLDDKLRSHVGTGVCSGSVLGVGALRGPPAGEAVPLGASSPRKGSPRKRIYVSPEVFEMINSAAQELNALQAIIEQDAEESGQAVPRDFQALDPPPPGGEPSPGRRPGSRRARWGTFGFMAQLCKRNPHGPQLGLEIPDEEEGSEELSPEGAVALGLHGPHGSSESPDKVKFETEAPTPTPKAKRAAWQTMIRSKPGASPVIEAPPPPPPPPPEPEPDPAAETESQPVSSGEVSPDKQTSPKHSVVPKLDIPRKKQHPKKHHVPVWETDEGGQPQMEGAEEEGKSEEDQPEEAEGEPELSPGARGLSTISAREYKRNTSLSQSAKQRAEEEAELARRAALTAELESMHRRNVEEKTRVRIMLDDDDDDDDEGEGGEQGTNRSGAKDKSSARKENSRKSSKSSIAKSPGRTPKGAAQDAQGDTGTEQQMDAMQKRRALLNIRASESGSEDDAAVGSTSRCTRSGRRSISGVGGRSRRSEAGDRCSSMGGDRGSVGGDRTTLSGSSRLARVSMTGGGAPGRPTAPGVSRLMNESRMSMSGRFSPAGSVTFQVEDAVVQTVESDIEREVRNIDTQPSFRSRPRSQSSPGMGLGEPDLDHLLDVGTEAVAGPGRRSEGGNLAHGSHTSHTTTTIDDRRKWKPVGGTATMLMDPIYTWVPRPPSPPRPSSAGQSRSGVYQPEWRSGGSLGVFQPIRFESASGADPDMVEGHLARSRSATGAPPPDWNARPNWRPAGIVWTDPYAHLKWLPPGEGKEAHGSERHHHLRDAPPPWVPPGTEGDFGPRHCSTWEPPSEETSPQTVKHHKETRNEPWKNPGSECKPLIGGKLDWGPWQPPHANPFARSDEVVPLPEANKHVGPAIITVKPTDRKPADVFFRRHYLPLAESSVYEEVEEVTLVGTQQRDPGTNKQVLHAAVVTYKNKLDDNVVGRAMRLVWEPTASIRPTTSHYLEVPIPVAGAASPPGGWLCPTSPSPLFGVDSSALLQPPQRAPSRSRNRTHIRLAPRLVVLPRPGHPSLLLAVQSKNRRHARAASAHKFRRNRQMNALQRALTPLGVALAAAMNAATNAHPLMGGFVDAEVHMPGDQEVGLPEQAASLDSPVESEAVKKLPPSPPVAKGDLAASPRRKQVLERTSDVDRALSSPLKPADGYSIDAVLARASPREHTRHSHSHFRSSLSQVPMSSGGAVFSQKLRKKTSLPVMSSTLQHQLQSSLKHQLDGLLAPDPPPPLSFAPLLPPAPIAQEPSANSIQQVANDSSRQASQAVTGTRPPPACMPLHLLPTPFMNDRARHRLERQLQTGPLLPRMLALATSPELLQNFPRPWEHTLTAAAQSSNTPDEMVTYLTAALGSPDLKAQSLQLLQPHGPSKSIGTWTPALNKGALSARQLAELAMSRQPADPVSPLTANPGDFRQQRRSSSVSLPALSTSKTSAMSPGLSSVQGDKASPRDAGVSPCSKEGDALTTSPSSNMPGGSRNPFGIAWLPMQQRKLGKAT